MMFAYSKIFTFYCLVFIFGGNNADDYCQTPDGAQGECKLITECEPLYKLLEHPISTNNSNFLRRSVCDFPKYHHKVCCPKNSSSSPLMSSNETPCIGFIPGVTPYCFKSLPNKTESDLPSIEECGLDTQSRVYRGKNTEIDEITWLALIEYKKPDGSRDFHCGGVLISKRYVLTAAHCVKGQDLPKNWELVSVRLGERDLETDPDCDNFGGITDCAKAALNVPVKEKIVHESYNPIDKNQYHDIALLRLSHDVNFSEFLSPICLYPWEEQNTAHTEDTKSPIFSIKASIVGGWGKTPSSSESDTKLKVPSIVKNNSECWTTLGVNLTEGQICSGGGKRRDTCIVDSGGPLWTYAVDKKAMELHMFLIGIASIKPSSCGTEGSPAVYTNVSKYIKWIVDKLKP